MFAPEFGLSRREKELIDIERINGVKTDSNRNTSSANSSEIGITLNL
jgi:hypothetical protein